MNNNLSRLVEKSRIGRNTTPKIISLIFAIVFWVYVMDQVNPEIIKQFDDVPVEIVGIEQIVNEGLVMMSENDYSVDITVQGRRNDLLSFDENYLVVTADIRGYQKGLNNVPIERRVLFEGVSIMEISKADIKVELDKIISIPKPIEILTTGSLPNGYQISTLEKDRLEIVVEGPETLVNKVTEMFGEINVSDMTEDFDTEIFLIPVDFEGNQVMGVEPQENNVNCDIGIDRLRTLNIVPQVSGEVQEGYQLVDILLIPKGVMVKGDSIIVNNTGDISTLPIDLTNITERTEVEIALALPNGLVAINIEDFIIAEVIVEKIETKEFIFDQKEIAYTNLDAAYDIEHPDAESLIKMILKDIGSVLENINKNDLTLTVDLDGLEPGNYELPISIESKTNIDETTLEPMTIMVTITEREE
jgi:YbbR domain-containing protein